VLVIDNYATGRRDNLTPQANLTIIEGTIADTHLVDELFEEFKPDIVIHAAAAYRDPDDWSEDACTKRAWNREHHAGLQARRGKASDLLFRLRLAMD